MVISTGMYIAAIVTAVIIVVTIPGCLLTIVTISTRPNLRKLVNVPLVSLSCADIIFAICGPALWIYHYLHPQWEPPGALCWFEAYTTPALFAVSIGHMLCIALQRYFHVCTNSTLLKSSRALIVMLSLTWLLPFALYLPVNALEDIKVDPKLKRCAAGGSAYLWAKIIPAISVMITPYVASIVCYALIQMHVRKSKNRVRANAGHHSNRLAVQFASGKQGGAHVTLNDAVPSTSTAIVQTTHSSRSADDGGVWMGYDRSSSSDEDQNLEKQKKPDKTKVFILVAPASDQKRTDKQHASQGSSSQSNAAERQITKMMMTLFAVFTACCLPMVLMVLLYSMVPSEALMVASVLVALNGALNPIVYGVMNKNIRQGYKHIWDSILNYVT